MKKLKKDGKFKLREDVKEYLADAGVIASSIIGFLILLLLIIFSFNFIYKKYGDIVFLIMIFITGFTIFIEALYLFHEEATIVRIIVFVVTTLICLSICTITLGLVFTGSVTGVTK